MSLPEPARFCPRCGAALGTEAACPRDSYRWFLDPKVAVGVLVQDRAGRLLLVRRNHDPALGQWAFPSGFVDAGEQLEDAAVREVREETQVDVELDRLLGAWSHAGDPVVFLAYAARLRGGVAAPGDEASEVAWVSPDDLPSLAFEHDDEVIAAWRSGAGAPARHGERSG